MDLKFSNRVINFISRNLIDLHSRYVSFYVKYVICKLKGVDIGLTIGFMECLTFLLEMEELSK